MPQASTVHLIKAVSIATPNLWALGRWQEAAPHAAAAVAAMPDLAAAHVLLGNILLRKQELDGALREYQTYLRLEPDGSMAAGTREMIEKSRVRRVRNSPPRLRPPARPQPRRTHPHQS
jgi:tetratricopeptide (TPR) repeat protein